MPFGPEDAAQRVRAIATLLLCALGFGLTL
jgi:hypothetical protein